MDLRWLFEALSATAFSQWLQGTRWGLATIEMAHLIGLAVFGGALLLDRGRQLWPARGSGLGLRGLYRAGLLAMVLSGVLLVAAEPIKCYLHPAFRWKMAFFALALLLDAGLGDKGSRWAAATSLTLWFTVGFLGRAIGFY